MLRFLALILFFGTFSNSSGQLFENLRAISGDRYPVGDPALTSTNRVGDENEGPKDISVADLDHDGKPDFVVSNKDGTLTLRFGNGDGTFSPAMHLRTFSEQPADAAGLIFTNFTVVTNCVYISSNFYVTNFTVEPPLIVTNAFLICSGLETNLVARNVVKTDGPAGLRSVAVADWNRDSLPDIAVASPGESLIYIFLNLGARAFAAPRFLNAWLGVRDLAAGDFDGDGRIDLAAGGATNGVVQYSGRGDGTLDLVASVLTLGTTEIWEDFPQPAFYLKAFRPPGRNADDLITARAQFPLISILRTNEGGVLTQRTSVSARITSFDVGPLLKAASNNIPDLVTGFSREGNVSIYPGNPDAWDFSDRPSITLNIPGAPRTVRVADFDNDGWNDLVVVSQMGGKILIYRNDQGTSNLASEALAGLSPRELDLADFNGDGRPDLAALNRFSFDVSILITSTNLALPVGFLALDGLYAVDGGLTGLQLQDFNNDKIPDVLQLHRDSAEYSVRFTDTNGLLSAPSLFPIDAFKPAAQISTDVNRDGNADMVSANLSGSVTVALGDGKGGFGEPQTFSLPAEANGSLFALVPGDFDGDGNIDLAAGYLDCRVSFFRGDGKGGFKFTHTHLFIYEPRSMVAADFDQDGDLDLAGGSWSGKFVVVENPDDLLSATALIRKEYTGLNASGATLRMVDQNKDGDPDFLFGSEGGFNLFLGGPGLTFTGNAIEGSGFSASTFVSADLDGDGQADLASVSPSKTILNIAAFTNNAFVTVLTVPIPSTTYLAAGDLDGDGLTDLVGSGDVLWVALSSHPSRKIAKEESIIVRPQSAGVVINEILAQNVTLPLPSDGNRTTDWVEIFNGDEKAVDLTGWQLMLIKTNSVTNLFTFASGARLEKNAHLLLICSDRQRTPFHTGFDLPAEGGTVCLIDNKGAELDRVNYPKQEEDLSYARYQDGLRSFVVNTIPSPATANVDNGAIDPVLSFDGVDLEGILLPRQLLRFRATARDDVGIVNVSVLWRRLDIPDNATRRVILYDDGINEDGPAFDGKFSGVLTESLPAGAEIQFYLECTDLTDQIVRTPGAAKLVALGQRPEAHTLTIGARRDQLEISEVLAQNSDGLRDENGGTPDWIEIRNIADRPVSLAGVGLSPKFFGNGERLDLSSHAPLAAGEHLVVFADSKRSQGSLHGPFQLDQKGEEIFLTGTTPNGARYLIDGVSFGPQLPNVSLSRLGENGPWLPSDPTPYAANLTARFKTHIEGNSFHLVFGTRPDSIYTVEFIDNLPAESWSALPPIQGTGLEEAVVQPLSNRRFYRVRDQKL